MKASDYADIGLYLRECRESLRISLHKAATDLHIRLKYLVALETGALSELPGKSYIRGYIRNYADYLNLDTDEVLAAYEALLTHKKQEFFIPEPTLKQNLPSRRILWFTLAGLLFIYFYWYFSIHDRSTLLSVTADIPPEIAQMLDNTAKHGMDTMGRQHTFDCLQTADFICYLALMDGAIPVPEKTYDDNNLPAPSPQKP